MKNIYDEWLHTDLRVVYILKWNKTFHFLPLLLSCYHFVLILDFATLGPTDWLTDWPKRLYYWKEPSSQHIAFAASQHIAFAKLRHYGWGGQCRQQQHHFHHGTPLALPPSAIQQVWFSFYLFVLQQLNFSSTYSAAGTRCRSSTLCVLLL